MPTIRLSKRFIVVSGIALAVLAALAPGAWALDVNGTYDGKIVCKGFGSDGQPFSQKIFGSGAQITRPGGSNDLHVAAFGFAFVGTIFDDADKITRAEASAISCSTAAEPLPLVFVAHLKFTLAGATLKFTAKSVVTEPGNVVATCTWTFKRTNATDPGVGGCPP